MCAKVIRADYILLQSFEVIFKNVVLFIYPFGIGIVQFPVPSGVWDPSPFPSIKKKFPKPECLKITVLDCHGIRGPQCRRLEYAVQAATRFCFG